MQSLSRAQTCGSASSMMQRTNLSLSRPLSNARGARLLAVPVAAAAQVSALPPSLSKLVKLFQMVPDPMARYKQLLFYATKLEKLPEELHTTSNKVEGCVSQVWVVPELRADGRVYWRADSDSQLTKGLAALLVLGLSGCTPQEITSLQTDFIEMLGLKQSLTPSRNNGFLNMLKLMQRKTLELAGTQEAAHESSEPAQDAQPAPEPIPSSGGSTAADSTHHEEAVAAESGSPVQDAMRRKLEKALQPAKLVIENKSAQHAGHGAMAVGGAWTAGKGANGESHFSIRVVSDVFSGKSLIQRHRMINQILVEEFDMGLHALQLDTKTPTEANR